MEARPDQPTASLRDRLSELRVQRPPEPRGAAPDDNAVPAVNATSASDGSPHTLKLPSTAVRITNAGGICWYYKTLASDVCPELSVDRDALHAPRRWTGANRQRHETAAGDAFVFDLETGGLSSSTPAFLIGAMALDEWPLTVHQWLAADYPEEAAVVRAFAEWIAQRRTWISFNGKSFDEPFVRDRGVILRTPMPPADAHLDLLHAARRRWKGELPNCRLQTLEQHILNRKRHGDVPSADVPDLFHFACATGNLRPLTGVLLHNQIDLVSCVELYLHLTEST